MGVRPARLGAPSCGAKDDADLWCQAHSNAAGSGAGTFGDTEPAASTGSALRRSADGNAHGGGGGRAATTATVVGTLPAATAAGALPGTTVAPSSFVPVPMAMPASAHADALPSAVHSMAATVQGLPTTMHSLAAAIPVPGLHCTLSAPMIYFQPGSSRPGRLSVRLSASACLHARIHACASCVPCCTAGFLCSCQSAGP
jgi:hypothetical protein